MNDSTELKCALFNANGSTAFKETRLTKAEVAQKYGIDGRDLRNADLVSEGIPHILVRPSAIFISIFTLRLLIQCDGALLFLLESETDGVKMQDVFEHNLQSRVRTEMGLGSPPSLPFELRVVDAALASVTAILEAEHLILRGEVERRLQDSKQEDIVHMALRELLEHGKKLVTIEQRARQVRSALQELLNNDDDLATMYLTDRQAGQPHAIEDHQEVEYLLEAYYKNADAIAESSSALVDEVNRTARAIQSILDVRRNQIMIFEAHIEIWMLGFAVSTFVAGLIGMNVVNYMEHSPHAIIWLASGCVIATLLISRIGMWKLRKVRKMQL
ncbi:Magnesium transporter MRS2/LPE10 [Penicillium lividum]|nr:Magnesium transporter MRS2/LPE10 [Penicillium lividum]